MWLSGVRANIAYGFTNTEGTVVTDAQIEAATDIVAHHIVLSASVRFAAGEARWQLWSARGKGQLTGQQLFPKVAVLYSDDGGTYPTRATGRHSLSGWVLRAAASCDGRGATKKQQNAFEINLVGALRPPTQQAGLACAVIQRGQSKT